MNSVQSTTNLMIDQADSKCIVQEEDDLVFRIIDSRFGNVGLDSTYGLIFS
jgi:hypothetical protein